jgi:hypothetical protein
MKRIVKLNEQEFEGVIKLLLEQALEEEDYVHIFLNSFSKWMSEKYPNTFESKPLSFLVKMYVEEFIRDLGLGYNENQYGYRTGLRKMSQLGRDIFKKGVYKYASLRPTTYFMEKFGKKIDFFLNKLELPDYVKLNIEEKLPWSINVLMELDFIKRLTNPDFKSMYASNVADKIEKFIINYLGVETGNPEHGELEFRRDHDFIVKGFEEWVKTDYKKFRKEIKSLPNANTVQRVTLELDKRNGIVSMYLIFKESSLYQTQKDYAQSVKDYAQQKGYNTEVLKISRK